jgi:hypothetical protein
VSDDPDAKPKSRVVYRWCVTLGLIGTLIGVCSGAWLALREIVRPLAGQQTSKNRSRQMQIAVATYSEAYDRMPGPFLDVTVERGATIPEKPSDRLSWRVTLLPYIESSAVYRTVNKSEAWNGPTNGPLLGGYHMVYSDHEGGPQTHTPYRVFHDNGALWDSDPKRRISLDKIPDGASNTILIAESTVQVPWAQFNEHPFDPNSPLPELGRASRNTFFLAMADGSVRVVKKSVSPNILRAAVTREGGEQLAADW